MKEEMFVNAGLCCSCVCLAIKYKGYKLSIVFDNDKFSKDAPILRRAELCIIRDGRIVTNRFYPGQPELVTISTFSELVDVKARIDAYERPRYEHDCANCKFLGRFEDADLYVCARHGIIDTVVARMSSEPSDYMSGLSFAYAYGSDLSCEEDSDMRFTFEAFKLAICNGYKVND